MRTITTLILARNHQDSIAEAITHFRKFSSEVIVMDTGSSDSTRAITVAMACPLIRAKDSEPNFEKIYLDVRQILRTNGVLFVSPSERFASANSALAMLDIQDLQGQPENIALWVEKPQSKYRSREARIFFGPAAPLAGPSLIPRLDSPTESIEAVITDHTAAVDSSSALRVLAQNPGIPWAYLGYANSLLQEGNYSKILGVLGSLPPETMGYHLGAFLHLQVAGLFEQRQYQTLTEFHARNPDLFIMDPSLMFLLSKAYKNLFDSNHNFDGMDLASDCLDIALSAKNDRIENGFLSGLTRSLITKEKNNLGKFSKDHV